MRPDKFFPTVGKWFGIALAMLALVSPAYPEWKEKVLYSFQGGPNDGATPAGGVVFDSAGNLYGATTQGGGSCPIDQCGTVFELTPPQAKNGSWTETLLHIFKGNTSGDGNTPVGGVILDSAGNLYGTTAYGGNGNCILLGTKAGCGAVFELTPPKQKGGAWTETVLYSFQGGKDGYFPNGNLVFDKAGNLYGATMFGGGKGYQLQSVLPVLRNGIRTEPAETEGRKVDREGAAQFRGSRQRRTAWGWSQSEWRVSAG